uniref:Uncharacterized protein n=1 Tax=Arundo donax TaxID=35708 RepID=A0A0A8XYI7_ARUDO
MCHPWLSQTKGCHRPPVLTDHPGTSNLSISKQFPILFSFHES